MKQPTRIEDRRNWKGQTVDYAAITAYEFRECQYCLTDAQVAVLGGIIEFLAWDTRWIGIPDGQESREWILQFKNDIQRRLMMGCCGDESPIQYQYTGDGELEQSEDGGITWTPVPEKDPRHYSTQFPPMAGDDGDDKKCIAATGMADLVKSQVGGQLTEDMSRYELAELLKDWTGTMIDSGANVFVTLLTIAANQIFALVITALIAALTDPVYDQLKCIFFCNMADDASFGAGELDSVTTDIDDQIGGIASLFLQQLVNLLGERGMTNLARAGGAAAGDCSDCSECTDGCDLTAWSIYHGTEISRGLDWIIVESTAAPEYGGQAAGLIADSGSCCYIASVQAVGTTTDYSGANVHSNCDETPTPYPSIQHNTIGTIACSQEMNMVMLYGALGSTQFKFTFSDVSC